jgi:hypothetical protein
MPHACRQRVEGERSQRPGVDRGTNRMQTGLFLVAFKKNQQRTYQETLIENAVVIVTFRDDLMWTLLALT